MKEEIYKLSNIGICYQKAGTLPWKVNKFWALENVSFSIYRGETVGIIGCNGSGKSTLLRLLAGITSPDKGKLFSKAKSSTLLSLGAGFDVRLTGIQNIYLNGLLLGISKKDIKEKIEDIKELADIGAAIYEPVKTYSTGMRSRLGFSIAYHVDAEVILLDEVLAPGDEKFRLKATTLIKEKIKEESRTTILVTHSLGLVEELCDRVVHIENRKNLDELPVTESIQRYKKV